MVKKKATLEAASFCTQASPARLMHPSTDAQAPEAPAQMPKRGLSKSRQTYQR